MATWDYWHPEILPHVPGCPNVLVDYEVKRTCQDFFEFTKAWQVNQAAIAVPASTVRLTITPTDTDTDLVKVMKAKYDNKRLRIVTPEYLDEYLRDDWEDETGVPCLATMLQFNEIRFYPTPSAAASTGLMLRMTVKPSESSTGIPDLLAQNYRDAIKFGALSRLMLYSNKEWSNPQMAAVYGSLYEDKKGSVQARTAKAHAGARIRSPQNWC